MESQSVICHPAAVTFPPLPQPKLILDLATLEECKAELTSSWVYLHVKDVIAKFEVLDYFKQSVHRLTTLKISAVYNLTA